MMYCLVNRRNGHQSFLYSKRELLDWIEVHSFCLTSRFALRSIDLHRVRTIRKVRGLNYSVTWKCAERTVHYMNILLNINFFNHEKTY